MTRGEIDLQQGDDMDVLVVSGEALRRLHAADQYEDFQLLLMDLIASTVGPILHQGWFSAP